MEQKALRHHYALLLICIYADEKCIMSIPATLRLPNKTWRNGPGPDISHYKFYPKLQPRLVIIPLLQVHRFHSFFLLPTFSPLSHSFLWTRPQKCMMHGNTMKRRSVYHSRESVGEIMFKVNQWRNINIVSCKTGESGGKETKWSKWAHAMNASDQR